MKNKVGVIKNPLSVIAIFAGIAEISGTMVLPHINPANQVLFIWFLMLFPFTLVVLFFITLNWNYKVLYAPSDFKDEGNFVSLQQASTSEVLLKIEDSINHQENESLPSISELNSNNKNTTLTQLNENLESALAQNIISSKAQRAQQSDIIKRINNQRMKEARLLEKNLIAQIQNEFSNTIAKDIKVESKNNKFIFDGVIQSGQKLTVFEVRRINLNTFNGSYLNRLLDNYKSFYSGLTEVQKNDFSLIFLVATDDKIEEVTSQLEQLFSTIDFNYQIKLYSIDTLTEDNVQVAS